MSIRKNGKHSYRFECMINRKRFSTTQRFYTETQSEIERAYADWKVSCEKSMFVNTDYTMEEFCKVWMENYVKPNCTAYVIKNYQSNIKNWIIPELGNYKLRDISPLVLDGFINMLKKARTKYTYRQNDKLSNGTIEKIYENVRTMITLAYKKGIINQNPCDRVSLNLKKNTKEKVHFWSVEDYKKVLSMLEKVPDQNKAFVVEFALKTGLRRSEMFGISWGDIDFKNGTISVNKTRQKVNGKMTICPCKTASSVRVITVPQSIIEKLKALRKDSNTMYIFENIDYDNITSWYRGWIRQNDLPYIRFHDLRHTHASLLLYKGIDIKTISERLGHSNIGTTMNIYTHVMKELDKKASEAIEAI